jgi:hypothetical protein
MEILGAGSLALMAWSLAALTALAFRLAGFTAGAPTNIRFARPRRSELVGGLLIGASAGFLVALVFPFWGWSGSDCYASLDDFLLLLPMNVGTGLVAGLVVGMFSGFVRAGSRVAAGNTPTALWRRDVLGVLAAGALFGLVSGLIPVLLDGYIDWVAMFILAFWVLGWLIVGVAASQAGHLGVVGMAMRLQGTGPVRMLRFLRDARDRQVLRQAGSVYQFRHARLQDRLAERYDRARTSSSTELK